MPIQINLLAETKIREEMRQRDPVKRVVLIGILLSLLLLAYSSSLLVQSFRLRGEVSNLEQSAESGKGHYSQVLMNQNDLVEGRRKIEALYRLGTNRFLVGNLLTALASSTVDNVQLTSFRLTQTYIQQDAFKPRKGERAAPRPATSTEKTTMTLTARDTSPVVGDAVNSFQRKLSTNSYFKEILSRTGEFRLLTLGTPQIDAEGRAFVLFTLEARLPDKTR